jgi:hypothetical protein
LLLFCTVKPVYNDHPWDPQLLRGGCYSKSSSKNLVGKDSGQASHCFQILGGCLK